MSTGHVFELVAAATSWNCGSAASDGMCWSRAIFPSPTIPIRIGIVGLGKIARDQHIPSLAADPQFQLVAAATSSKTCPVDIPFYATLGEMITATPGLEAVALCTPPQVRYALAREALDRGLHVLLEKPPGG